LTGWLARRPRATAIVSFAQLPGRWVAFIVRAGDAEPRVEELDIDDDDLVVLSEVYRGTGDRRTDDDGAASRLLSPIHPHLSGIDCVGLVLYGGLHYVPIHALPFGDGLLIDSAAVVSLPSATVAVRNRRTDRIHTGATRALVVGNPAGDLPAAEHEAMVVAQLFGVQPLIREAATVERVRHGMRDADLIHIAAHAMFSSADPFSSGILLAGGEVLAARDIMAERIGSALVVLSACETGVQYARISNSLDGLIRAFLYAGAQSLVVSLWEVNDMSTMLLLTEFYKGVTEGLGACEALRRAQLANQSLGDPYHWAPFVVVGAPD
jgi:CHAT domain-containing protein